MPTDSSKATAEEPSQERAAAVPSELEQRKANIRRLVAERQSSGVAPYSHYGRLASPILEAVDRRKKELENISLEQDIELKRKTLNRLFLFLGLETFIIFTFTFFQAIKWPVSFHLEEWSFKLLVLATITQITSMLAIAVRHLFPKGR